MKLILLEEDNLEQYEELVRLLKEFQEEVYGSNTEIDIDTFIKHHYAIYLAVKRDKVVGFTSFVYNGYYGLREATIGNDYIYIEPNSRRSKAMHLFSIQAGKVCENLGLPLEHYIVAGSGSEKFVGRLEGKKLYSAYIYNPNEVSREYHRLRTKVRLKD